MFRHIATKLSTIPAKQVEQIIDDLVACGTRRQVEEFHGNYRKVAMDCGVQLAPEDDKRKAFSARQEREVFGVMYCTRTFSWWLGENKLAVIVNMLIKVEESDLHTVRFLKTVTGKLVHYRMLVPQGKYYLGQLIRSAIAGQDKDLDRMVTVSDWGRAEAWYWRNMLPFCGRRTLLPDPEYCLPPWTLHGNTDAAGGQRAHQGLVQQQSRGYGVGAVLGPHWWAYLPWGILINSDAVYRDGKRLDSKMSAWELLGPLLLLTAGVEMVRGKSLIIPVDNAGSVAIYRKGWCTSCMLCTTLALAISQVAAAIHCKLEIVQGRLEQI